MAALPTVPSFLLQQNPARQQEDYFLIVHNCRKGTDALSTSEKDMPMPPEEEEARSSPSKKEESAERSPKRRKRGIKKEKKSKNYSSVSQNKRQIAVRYKDRSEEGSSLDPQLIQLWNQLWQVEFQYFRRTRDIESLKFFGVNESAPLQTMEPEIERAMTPIPSPEPRRERIELQQPPQENYMDNEFAFQDFHFENSYFVVNEDSQSQGFFFDRGDE